MARDITSLIGKKFGKLTVLSYFGVDKRNKSLWLVRCDCGKELLVRGDQLTAKTNPKTHCGCDIGNSLIGQRFGKLTVIGYVRTEDNIGKIWLVECDCGKKFEVEGGKLTRTRQPMNHCGCLTSQHRSDALKGNNATHGLSKTRNYKNEREHHRKIQLRNSTNYPFNYLGSIKKSRDELNYCVYCGSTDSLSTDHIIPIKKGGSNDFQNLITACLSCNCGKGSSFFIDWYLKTKRNLRSLSEIISDMGFDSIYHLQNYQDAMCPEYLEENRSMVTDKLLRAERKSIRSLARYYRSLDHYPTH